MKVESPEKLQGVLNLDSCFLFCIFPFWLFRPESDDGKFGLDCPNSLLLSVYREENKNLNHNIWENDWTEINRINCRDNVSMYVLYVRAHAASC